LYNNFEF